ncbi:hypothetical protein NDS46_18045 [Paenibacillus thiaminolyticus]|uniref:hypothetical protein n=1 Tax=Paenibacillus thiaminolyticus TaxID=49283 RepID=UPI00232D9A6E|nr:hypothetical protein [Paenibacillus thiaminolyticus]WCF06258.1 hypothetical protein NDS46_18045 [Paenibacillus thiaminolyticus]
MSWRTLFDESPAKVRPLRKSRGIFGISFLCGGSRLSVEKIDLKRYGAKSAKRHNFSNSVSEILRQYSNSIWTTLPERESCKTAGISPVSLRLEAKGLKMM